MKIQELQKGERIKLANGWEGTLKGKPGNKTTVLAEVEGFFTEIGSVYCHDILYVRRDEAWLGVEHTPTQLKLKQQVDALGF